MIKNLYNNWYRIVMVVAVLTAFLPTILFAQAQVTGTVVDETGSPLPGVSIVVKGTSNGTSTDVDGKYTLSANPDAVLVFSFIGYQTTEESVGNRSAVNVTLSPDATALEEVVVTGYGIDKRRELTGSVSTVKAKDLTYAPTGNVEQMLQGRVAGVTVITNGQPGTTSQIRVRGFGAFGGNTPLYIVDGVPTPDVNFLNPDDIETTTVLKDAASASIYGARAASGVIVYTTKRGKKGDDKVHVTYDNLFGVTTPGQGQEMLNPTEFADWTWRAIRNTAVQNGTDPDKAIEDFNHPQFGKGTSPVIPEYLTVGTKYGVTGGVDLEAERLKYNIDPRNGSIYQVTRANLGGTDWYDAITQNAPIFRQTLGFSGGGQGHRFYFGLSTQDQKGILLHNTFKRYAVRANSEFDVLKNLRIGENIQVTYRQVLGLSGDDGGQGIADDENDILQAFRMPTIIPVYDVFGGYAGTGSKGFNNPRNPVANREGQRNNGGHEVQGFGNVYLEYDPIPEITLRTSIGGRYANYNIRGYSRWQYENSENNSAFGFNQNSGYSMNWVFTNTATFKKTFDVHNVEVLLGQEALNTGAGWDMGGSGLNPFSWTPDYINLNNVDSRQVSSQQFKGSNFSSLFGNLKYTFKEKYIVGAVVRRDGSSRFGENNRYGVFPAFSAAWRVSAEPFMQNVPVVSDLKIRAGYGLMGNSNGVDPNNQFSLYGGSLGASSYDLGGTNSSALTGFYRTRIGNPDAQWETSITKNVGIDALLFDGKLDVIIDFWQKDTEDLLLQVPITATAGPNAAPPSVNVGSMRNRGIDIFLESKGNFNQTLGYEFTLNASFLKNEITGIAPGLTYLTTVNPSYRGIAPIRNQLGYSISAFYGYQVVGLYRDQDEVRNSAKQSGAAPGRFRYKDINGDNVIDDKDRTYLGSPVPKFTGGVNFKLKAKGFDLEGYLYTSLGNKIFNVSRWFTDFYPSFQGASISARVKDSWTFENPTGSIPLFESASNFSTNTQANSFYVENGNYLRLQNITLGYNVPVYVLERFKLAKVRIFVSSNNVFTISNYSGLDPAVGGAADTNFGIDLGNYPVTRSYTAGVNIGL